MAEPKKFDQRSADIQHDQGVRQDEQGVTQDEQGVTQEEQGVTQIEQGVTQIEQGITQVQQGATQVAQGIEQEAQANAMAAQSFNILAVTDGVHVLAGQVQTLNERVYAKSELDRTRNRLLVGSVVTFVVLGCVLGGLLWRINDTAHAEAKRARDRSVEAVASRRALADCTSLPGTVLDNGYVNPGVCFKQTAERTQTVINDAINRIFIGLRSSEDCLYLRGQSLRPPACAAVNTRVDTLIAGGDPFSPTTTTTTTPSTTPSLQVRPATTVQVSPSPASSLPPVPTAAPVGNLLRTLLCAVLVLIGGC